MNLDLGRTLLPDTPVLEIFLRGALTYFVLLAMLWVTINRSSSSIGMTDSDPSRRAHDAAPAPRVDESSQVKVAAIWRATER